MAILLAAMTLPVLYGLLLTSTFNPDTPKPYGILAFFVAPLKMLGAWFMDIPHLFRNLSFSAIKSPKTRSLIARSLKGAVLALPFMFIFLLILASADMVFGKYVSDLLSSLFSWFKDWSTFINSIVKMFVGGVVSIYTMVYFLSLWNKDSELAKMTKYEKPAEEKQTKRNWDIITTSVFMGGLNLVFVAFVIVQLQYLFGGNENVIGASAGYTYAEYARKGFFELVFVTAAVYLIALVLNAKVFAANLTQKVIFRVNYGVLVLSTLVITLSALSRISLYQSIYGFTVLRLFITYSIVVIGIMLVVLLISAFVKNSLKMMGRVTVFFAMLTYLLFIVMPLDLFVGKLNVDRYFQTGRLDARYLLTLSDEAIPAMVELVKNPKTSAATKNVVMEVLELRESYIKDQRKDWQSLNFVDQYNKYTLNELLKDEKDWKAEKDKDVKKVLSEYGALIEQEKFEEAFQKYWSAGSKKFDLSKVQISVDDYVYEGVDTSYNWFNDGYPVDSRDYDGRVSSGSIPYVAYLTVRTRYTVLTSKPADKYYDYAKYGEKVCKIDHIRLELEGGEWKITSSYVLPLGQPEFGYSSYSNDPFEYLYNTYSYTCGGSSYVR